jgi:hypothetical protein
MQRARLIAGGQYDPRGPRRATFVKVSLAEPLATTHGWLRVPACGRSGIESADVAGQKL